MLIQVVSSMRNEVENIPHFIKLIVLLRSELNLDLQAVLVNNGSNDGTSDLISSLPRESFITFLENPSGSTYADGMEKAIASVTSPYILIIPSDLQFDEADVLKVLKLFMEKTEKFDKELDTPIALLTFRKYRTDGVFMKLRGDIWRRIVTRKLMISSKLDPASQLKIIPTPRNHVFDFRNFLWDIEILLWALKHITSYEIVDVGFKSRIYGESSLSKNPFKPIWLALLGLSRLSHKAR